MEKRFAQPILREAYRYIYQKKGNCIIGITGPVNTGKSHLSILLGHIFCNKFDINESLIYSVESLIDKSLSFIKYKGKPLSFDKIKEIDDVRNWLRDNMDDIYIHPGKVIIMDETGALGAYVREFFSMDNKSLAKIIQIWRILRMLCIFVVPEDMRLAESTISRFMNLEIRMISLASDGSHATCLAWEYRGWNKRTKEPIRHRLEGCKDGGFITIPPLPEHLTKEYEDFSRSEKIAALVDMGKDYQVNKRVNIGRTKSIWDDVKYVKNHLDEFKNERGKVTIPMIRSKLGITEHRAREIRAHVAIVPHTPVEEPKIVGGV